ncbi:MAG: membrane-bound lytic murein transglycosylase D [Bacteroidia bacterium]|jgi:membrane-bound lytic murein transglycosylase D
MKIKFVLIAIGLSFQCTAQLSDATLRTRLDSLNTQVPLDFNEDVRSAIFSYNTVSAKTQQVLATYITYDKDLIEVFKENNVPVELRFASISISDCDYLNSHSDGREGFFDMSYSVAKKHGLTLTNYVDERRDVLKSAEVFCKEIAEIFAKTGDWRKAITIYASSDVAWQKARILSADTSGDYWPVSKYLDQELREVYPKMVGAIYLGHYYKKLGYKVAPLQIKKEQVLITQYTTLYQLATQLDIKYDLLQELNPIYKKKTIPQTDQKVYLTIPSNRLVKFNSLGSDVYNYAQLPTYTRTEVKAIGNVVFGEKTVTPTVNISAEKTKESGEPVDVIYAVRNGDMLSIIADLYDCEVVQIIRWNNLDGDRIDINQKLVIKVESAQKTYYQKIDRMNREQRKAIQRKD